MTKQFKNPLRQFGWPILLYGLGMGLLLVVLQTARYHFLILDHAQELYFGLIAVVFTVLGVWAGRQIAARRKPPAKPLSGIELDNALDKLSITPREYEVLQFIAQGLSNQEIAERMFVSLNTIKTHNSNLFSKLDAQRRTQAVQKAQAIGLLTGTHPKV